MRVQLLHPPVFLNVRSLTALRPAPPLGLAYVAAALRKAGHEVTVLDAVAEGAAEVVADGRLHRLGLDSEEILERIDPDADLIGISNMWSFSWPLVRKLIDKIKRHHPDKILVGGGEHFSGLPEESLRDSPLDYVVIGEGELTVVELVNALNCGTHPSTVAGIAYVSRGTGNRGMGNRGQVIRTPARTRNQDVDEIPWPAWDLIDLEAYNRHGLVPGLRGGFTVPILATRGCPYRCTYCSSPSMWTTKWVPRKPALVADEIESYVKHYGADNFPFQDLTAILKRDWIVEFCRELIDRKLAISWQLPSGTRCEVVDDEVAALLHQSGCRHLAFAPESGSEVTRERINKRMTEVGLLGAVRSALREDLSLSCFFVVGFPEDTRSDLKASVRLARRLAFMGAADVAVGYFFPIPNTELYRELVREGRIKLDDEFLRTPIFANDPFLKQRNNYCKNVSAARLSFIKHWIVANFYAISFATRPWRVAKILMHLLRGTETMKLESFLLELGRKMRWWLTVRRKRPLGAPPATSGTLCRKPPAAARTPARERRSGPLHALDLDGETMADPQPVAGRPRSLGHRSVG